MSRKMIRLCLHFINKFEQLIAPLGHFFYAFWE